MEERNEPLKPEIVDDPHIVDADHDADDGIRPYPGLVSTDGTAIIALGLAIASWVAIPIIGAIAALVVAPSAKRRIRESEGLLGGIGLVKAAQVIAILNLALFVFVAWLIVLLLKAIF